MGDKRRLPVVQSSGRIESDDSERAEWQWVAFGAGAIFVAWLPLSAAALALAARASSHVAIDDRGQLARVAAVIVALYAAAIALGALGGGFVMGRWAAKGGVRSAILAGATATAVAVVLSSVSSGFAPRLLLVAVVAVPMAAAGAAAGKWARPR